MYYDEESGPRGFLTGLLIGVLLGMGAAMLANPERGQVADRVLRRVRLRGRAAYVDDDRDEERARRRRRGRE